METIELKDVMNQLPVADLVKNLAGVDKNGVPSQFTMENIAAVVGGKLPILNGIFIMYHTNINNLPRMVEPRMWPKLQSSGEIAEGVAIVEGGKILVVAPTESSQELQWSNDVVSGGGTTTLNIITASNDWSGKENTSSQIKHPECSNINCASGFCSQYSRANANGKGLTAGKWWLPALGELMMIYANKSKINYALSLISGAAQLTESWHWCSTEANDKYAWFLYLDSGNVNYISKVDQRVCVRAVSEFIY